MIRTIVLRSALPALLVAAALAAATTANAATNLNGAASQAAPVNFWISPIATSTQDQFIVSFDLYMASTTENAETRPVALRFQTCNGASLKMSERTRHLTNGETLVGTKGGGPYDEVTAMQWTRLMGVPPIANAVKLHLSFISDQPGNFCLYISDASEPFGPRYVQISIGMK